MPTYDYRCPEGHEFEKFFRKISESVDTLPCTVCGAEARRKVSGGAGLLFKGSGFYITDYGKDGKGVQRKESKDSGDSASGSEGGAKPAESGSGSSADKPASDKPAPSSE